MQKASVKRGKKSGKKSGRKQKHQTAKEAQEPQEPQEPQEVVKEKTNVESSIRLSPAASAQYKAMADGDKTQKTEVIAKVAARLIERLIHDPAAFRNRGRAWLATGPDAAPAPSGPPAT